MVRSSFDDRRRTEFDEGRLRISALRGGTISEITDFLHDLEEAYNALYSFELWKNSILAQSWFNVDDFYFRYRSDPREANVFLTLSALISLSNNNFTKGISGNNEINPVYRLELSRVLINSPGFWEFIGSLNPLAQIREYLKDRHERRKDRDYRESSEKEKLKLENELLRRKIFESDLELFEREARILREAGVDQEWIKQTLWERLGLPLAKLGRHQDQGLIAGPSDDG